MAAAILVFLRAFSSCFVVPLHRQSQKEERNINFKTSGSAEPPLSAQVNVVRESILFSTREIRRLHEEDASNSWRESYNDATEVWKGVPFEWESRPGIPKQDLLNTENESQVIYPLSLPPRLRAMRSFQSGSTKSSEKSFHNKMRELRSPTQGWLRKAKTALFLLLFFSQMTLKARSKQ